MNITTEIDRQDYRRCICLDYLENQCSLHQVLNYHFQDHILIQKISVDEQSLNMQQRTVADGFI